MYGDFLNNLITFVLVAFAVYFFVITPMQRLFPKKQAEALTKQCGECKSSIPLDATRCAFCTQAV
jgi:large conductance mechanosensitive channel